jgi:hypothetical protein
MPFPGSPEDAPFLPTLPFCFMLVHAATATAVATTLLLLLLLFQTLMRCLLADDEIPWFVKTFS